MKKIFESLALMMDKKCDTVLVSIIAEAGSSPRGTGSQMLVGPDGLIAGTIGGGAVEKNSIEMAQQYIADKKSGVYDFVLRQDSEASIGMECGGDVSVYFQYIDGSDAEWKELTETGLRMLEERTAGWLVQKLDGSNSVIACKGEESEIPSDVLVDGSVLRDGMFVVPLPVGERAIIFGGGHCAEALAPVLHSVGFRITVMDDRAEFVTAERYPMAERRICGDYTTLGEYIDFRDDDYVVVMTSGHAHDFEVESQIIDKDVAYLGVIGSKRKTAIVNDKLRAMGFTEEQIAGVHAPIGISIKSATPAEIAVSIAAEMILVRAEIKEQLSAISRSCPVR